MDSLTYPFRLRASTGRKVRQGKVHFKQADHNPDTGLAGKVFVVLAVGGLVWGLWALTQL